MKRFIRSPFFYAVFIIASAIAHYLLISTNAYDLVEGNSRMNLFMPPATSNNPSPWEAGPLIFAFYKSAATLLQPPPTAFYAGSALLSASFTFALLRFLASFQIPAPVLFGAGIWSAVSPTTVLLAAHYPHILLGLIFLLLMFIALMRHRTLLVLIFIIHLFFTLQILGWLSITLLILYRSIYPRYQKRPQ